MEDAAKKAAKDDETVEHSLDEDSFTLRERQFQIHDETTIWGIHRAHISAIHRPLHWIWPEFFIRFAMMGSNAKEGKWKIPFRRRKHRRRNLGMSFMQPDPRFGKAAAKFHF